MRFLCLSTTSLGFLLENLEGFMPTVWAGNQKTPVWNFNKTCRISTKAQKCIHRHIFLVCGRCIPVPQTVFNNNLTFSHDAFIHFHFWLLASIGGIGTMPIIWLLQEATVYVHFCCKTPLELFPINEVFGSQPGDFVFVSLLLLVFNMFFNQKKCGNITRPHHKS